MLGLMQDWPLLLHRIIDHAAIQHGRREVVSRAVEDGTIQAHHLCADPPARAAGGQAAGSGRDQRRATGSRRWPGTPSAISSSGTASPASGAITHTVNPRLFPEQIAWIIDHAGDRLLFLDLSFVKLMEGLQDKLPSIERFVVLTDAYHMPDTSLRGAVPYEDWLAEADDGFRLGQARREHRRRAVLHLRHHGRAQGRALFAPLQRAACAGLRRAGLHGPVLARHGAAGGAAVPRQ